MQPVNCCCNILWLICFGWELCLVWCVYGVIYCISIIGIPFGIQAFKIGCYVLWPFGKKLVDKSSESTICCACCSCVCNVIWFIFGGIFLGLFTAFISIFFFISIIGIPFGVQLCKLALICFCPFGKEVVDDVAPNGPVIQSPSTQDNVQIYQSNPPTSSK